MKKIFVLLLLFLFSCSSSDEQALSTSGLKLYDSANFSIQTPLKWIQIDKNDEKIPKPKSGVVEIAMASDELRYGFSNNMLVLSQDIEKIVTSKSFSILNNVGSTKEFLEYTELEKQNIKFASGDESIVYIFEAKYNASTPKLKYFQMGAVCDYKKAYLITIAISTDIKDNSGYLDVLKSFKCK